MHLPGRGAWSGDRTTFAAVCQALGIRDKARRQVPIPDWHGQLGQSRRHVRRWPSKRKSPPEQIVPAGSSGIGRWGRESVGIRGRARIASLDDPAPRRVPPIGGEALAAIDAKVDRGHRQQNQCGRKDEESGQINVGAHLSLQSWCCLQENDPSTVPPFTWPQRPAGAGEARLGPAAAHPRSFGRGTSTAAGEGGAAARSWPGHGWFARPPQRPAPTPDGGTQLLSRSQTSYAWLTPAWAPRLPSVAIPASDTRFIRATSI